MKREFKVEANVGEPQVAYREAITVPATVDYTHKKQSGGSGQYAKIKVAISVIYSHYFVIIINPIPVNYRPNLTTYSLSFSLKLINNPLLNSYYQIEFSPKDDGAEGECEFVSEIKGGAVPKEYIPGVQKGIESGEWVGS